jgi:hypothetical protein
MLLRTLGLVAACFGIAALVSSAEAGYRTYPPDVLIYPHYSPDAAYPPPPIPDCGAMAARFGPERLWVGTYSGRRTTHTGFRGLSVEPYGARGCFLAEADCRRWLHENASYAGEPIGVMSCRPVAEVGLPR